MGPCSLVLGQACALDFLDFLEQSDIDSFGIIDPACGIGACDDLCAQLLCLLDRVDRDVACAGDRDGLAFKACAVVLEELLGQVYEAVAGSLGPCQGAAVGEALAGQNAFIQCGDSLVLAVQEADLAAAYADIACGYVGVCADMSVKLSHEALAECHDFAVGFALGIEIGAALAAADGEAGQGILEDLLEAEELDDAQVYGRVEAKAALVRSDRAVELDTETVVDLNLTLVIDPRNAEEDGSLRGGQTLKQSLFAELLFVGFNDNTERLKDFLDGLMELGLSRILRNYLLQNFINIRHINTSFNVVCRKAPELSLISREDGSQLNFNRIGIAYGMYTHR